MPSEREPQRVLHPCLPCVLPLPSCESGHQESTRHGAVARLYASVNFSVDESPFRLGQLASSRPPGSWPGQSIQAHLSVLIRLNSISCVAIHNPAAECI